MGALHGLNPASGWAMAAARGLHARKRAQAWWALLPIALGHAASVTLVAIAVVYGLSFDRTALQLLVATVLVIVLAGHLWRRRASPRRWPTGAAGLALGSFLMSGAHGAGLMLVPALVPLCLGAGPVSEAGVVGPIALALVAVGLHMAAMLLVTGLLDAAVCAGASRVPVLAAVISKVWRAFCATCPRPPPSSMSIFARHVRREHVASPSTLTSHLTRITP